MVLQYAVGGAMLPFLSLLLRDRGLTLAEISLVLLAGAAVMLVSPFFWGMLADRYVPLNRLFVVMNLGAVIFLLAFVRQHTVPGLVLCFAAFYACYQPTPILVNAIALRHLTDPQRQFAPLRAWGSVGWILPSVPLFAWLIWSRQPDLEVIVWLSAGCAMGMAFTALGLPHTPPGVTRRQTLSLGYWSAMRRLLLNRGYLVVLASYLLVSASFAIQAFYSPPRLEDLGMTRPWIGLAQSLGVAWEVLLFLGRRAILNRLGYAGSIFTGCVMLLIRQLLFAWADNLWVLAASYLLVGTTVVLYHIGVNLVVEAIAGSEVKSTAQTLLTLCSSGVGPLFANLAVGRMMAGGRQDLTSVFLLSAALTLGACVVLALWGRSLAATAAARRV